VPKEQPLQGLTTFELVFEAKLIVLIGKLKEVKEFGACFHDRKWRRFRIVHKDGDATVRVESKEPVFLLFIGHDVAMWTSLGYMVCRRV